MGADFVLLDDQAARQAARLLHQPYTGLAGLLLRGKAAGFFNAPAPVLRELTSEAGFFLAPPVYREVLRLTGEDPSS
jgi:predicted nucleic acid-binding protein